MLRHICALAMSLGAAAASADSLDLNGDGYVDILIPIVIRADATVPGAYGSVWRTEAWVHNGNDVGLRALQPNAPCDTFPGAPDCESHPAHQTSSIYTIEGPANAGALYTVPAPLAEELRLSARLLELSRGAQPNGIDLPVVWEHEFLRRPTRLVGIPSDEAARAMLRIYDVRRAGMAFDVSAYAPDGRPLGTISIASVDPHAEFDDRLPFTAIVPDLTALLPALQLVERYDLVIAPKGENPEYWGFVSVTDRDSQHVLLVTPDR